MRQQEQTMNAYQTYSQKKSTSNAWIAKPLGLTGDLAGWQRKMRALCPAPTLNQIVYMDKIHANRYGNGAQIERIGYKAINIKSNGDAVWQRGFSTWHDADTDLH